MVETLEKVDLETQAARTEELRSKAERLLSEIYGRIANLEQNLQQLTKLRKETLPALREKYDLCLDKGEASAAEKCLGDIKKAHKDVVNLAKNIVGPECDIGDLNERQNQLRLEVLTLVAQAEEYILQATESRNQTFHVMATAGDAAEHHLRQLEQISQTSKRVAEEILSE